MFGWKAMRRQLSELTSQIDQFRSQCDALGEQMLKRDEELKQLRAVQTALRIQLDENMERSEKAVEALFHRIEMKLR